MTRPSLLLCGLAALAAGCTQARGGPPAAPLPPAIHVQEAAAEERPMPKSLPLTGSLVANQQSEVAANASGRVIKTLVERGTFVKAGAALAQLDTRTAQLSDQEARANLKNAQTMVELANGQCTRNQELYRKGAISKDEWERASSQCQTSLANAEAARARSDLAQKMLSDATVRAPFSGMVGERYVSVGEYVQPPTRVVTLVELDPLRLQLTVGEADIGRIHENQEVQFEVDAYPGAVFTATVKYIDPTVRTSTRDLVVEATVANPDHRLRPGMFATAHVQLPDEPVVAVPKKVLREDSSSTRLFAVVDGQAEERIVQRGPERDGYVAILDGLKPGERVVLDPGEQVKDGVPVVAQ